MKKSNTTLYYKVYSIDNQDISNINYVLKIVYNNTMIVDVKELRDPQMKKSPRIKLINIDKILYQEFNSDACDWYKHAPLTVCYSTNKQIGIIEYVKYYRWFGTESTNTYSYLTNKLLKVITDLRVALSK